jgi:hypothetical protein
MLKVLDDLGENRYCRKWSESEFDLLKVDPTTYPKKPPLESYQWLGTFKVIIN